MQVRMLRNITGFRDGVAWPGRGGVVDVTDAEAARLIASRHAEPVDDQEVPSDERAAAEEGDRGTAAEGDSGAAQDGDEEAGEATLTPPDGKVDEVLAWVGDDPGRARAALDVEQSGLQRRTLISALEDILDRHGDMPPAGSITDGV